MTVKEKAKRYDEALEIARQYWNDRAMPIGTNFKLERMFPELMESEGEGIRKELISFVRGMLACHDKPNAERDEKYESWIAWLEKQGQQKPIVIIPKFRVGDEIKTSNEESLTITKIDENGYWSEDLFICGFDEECIWDLVGQKHADKIEPKFKVGDWIVTNKNHIWYVDETPETTSYLYRLINQYGKVEVAEFEVVDNAARFWTIQDAKDGDILSWDNGRYTIIFKELKDNKIIAHCSYNNHSEHFRTQGNYDTMFDSHLKFVLGTKEQRDFLFQKMKDAGYTFDFEKKELKKIEQKPWS